MVSLHLHFRSSLLMYVCVVNQVDTAPGANPSLSVMTPTNSPFDLEPNKPCMGVCICVAEPITNHMPQGLSAKAKKDPS